MSSSQAKGEFVLELTGKYFSMDFSNSLGYVRFTKFEDTFWYATRSRLVSFSIRYGGFSLSSFLIRINVVMYSCEISTRAK